MAGITALNKIRRQQAAFGGVMGKDGRKAYVGGSYSTQGTSDGKERGSYQGKDDSGKGYGGTYSGGGDGPDRSAVEKGSQYYAANNPPPKVPKEKKKLNINIPNIKDIYDYGKNYIRNRKKGIYNIVPNNPKNELQFLSILKTTNPAKYNTLPQNLKNLLEATQDPTADFTSYKEFPKFSYDDFESLTQFDDGAFAKYAKDIGSPGLSVAGDMSQVGLKSVRRDPITGEPIKDMFGNTLFDYGPPDGSGRGEGNQSYVPINYGIGVGTGTTDDVAEETTFDYRFGDEQKVGRDVTLGYAANGGRITRAGGGIMNAVPRQGYFLGKIVKGVGKAIGSVADAAGKVLKSDVGKMAIAGLGAYYMGGGMNLGGARMFGNTGFGSTGFLSNLGRMRGSLLGQAGSRVSDPRGFIPYKEGILTKLGLTQGGGSFMPTLKGILAGSAILPFIPGINKVPENEDIGMGERGGRLKDSLGNEVLPAGIRSEIDKAYESGDPEQIKRIEDYYAFLPPRNMYLPYPNYAVGGRVAAQEGGLMNLGGMEKDYRNEGGFVPIGKQEKADDVPARLSVNEFVFTADAVRNAGGGDIDKGAEVMENMMKNLENGGRVSEESQGNAGAQEMFSVSERIGEVI